MKTTTPEPLPWPPFFHITDVGSYDMHSYEPDVAHHGITRCGFTVVELLVVVLLILFVVAGGQSGSTIFGGRLGWIVGGLFGFALFALIMMIIALLHAVAIGGIPHLPPCRRGRCRARDYELSPEELCLICRCGDRYRRQGRQFKRIVDGQEVPYLKWRPFRGWRADVLTREGRG